jgi:hypothetical protein
MKQLFLLACLLISVAKSNAQLQVQVKDAETKQPLSFATAEGISKTWGTYSDSAGRVIIPDSVWKTSDISFSYVGYSPSKTRIYEDATSVFLKKILVETFASVKNCPSTKSATIKNYKKSKHQSAGWKAKSEGFIWAGFLPNTAGKHALMTSIDFHVKSFHPKAMFDAPVRLRLYQYDLNRGLPGEEITKESILITPKKFGKHTEDLSIYKMYIPIEGVVAGFEMFDAGSRYHYIYHMKFVDGTEKDVEMYGWSLGSAADKAKGFRKFPGRTWEKNLNVGGSYYAPAVSFSVKVCSD